MSHRPPDVTGKVATAYNGAILVEWDPPTDSSITGHKYQINPSPAHGGGTWLTQVIPHSGYGEVNSYWVFIEGLDNGTEYSVIITAINNDGFSKGASTVHATPTAEVPAQIKGLTATALDERVLLEWTPTTDRKVDFHKVMMSPPPGEYLGVKIITVPDSGQGESNNGEYLIEGLTNDVYYVFTVFAGSNRGLSFRSAPVYAYPASDPAAQDSGTPWIGFPGLPQDDDDDGGDDNDDPEGEDSGFGFPSGGVYHIPGFPGIPVVPPIPPPDYTDPHYIDPKYDPCSDEYEGDDDDDDEGGDTNPHPGDNGGGDNSPPV